MNLSGLVSFSNPVGVGTLIWLFLSQGSRVKRQPWAKLQYRFAVRRVLIDT